VEQAVVVVEEMVDQLLNLQELRGLQIPVVVVDQHQPLLPPPAKGTRSDSFAPVQAHMMGL
jgi:hypothetical protein